MAVEKQKIALVGLGGISQSVHLPIIDRLHDQVELVAVADLSKGRAEEIAGVAGKQVRGFTSVEELLASEISAALDGAVVATTGTHGHVVEQFLEAGIPVLAEKPLALSIAEHNRLEERFPAHAQNLRVGYMKEYDPGSQAAQELLKDVEIVSVHVEVLHPRDEAQLLYANLRPAPTDVNEDALREAQTVTNEALASAIGADLLESAAGNLDRLYPNVLLGSVIHDIALLRYLVGGIGTVDVAQHYGPDFPGSLFLRGELATHPAPWTIDWHFIADYPEYRETVTVHHTTGTIRLAFAVPYQLNVATELQIVRNGPRGSVETTAQEWPQKEAFVEEWAAFLDMTRGNPQPGSALTESAADIRTGQKMLRKLAESKGIRITKEAESASA